ncbi:Expansin-A1 [Carex littledalei]|uniref:Expansin n=1 Tax=Carex littledalei TaxID=544730 RepID=A0A833QW57_9POAL|nr:Expansin-A1 [Carex littledalei]
MTHMRPQGIVQVPFITDSAVLSCARRLILCLRVPCARKGGIRFTINGYSYFNLVLIWNVGGAGSIKAVWVKGSRPAWQVMQPNMGTNWLVVSYLDGQSLSFLVTNTDSQTMLFQDIMVLM